MDAHQVVIWQRDSPRSIMHEARRRFKETREQNQMAAYVALASTHYSLIECYSRTWWQKPLALWHMSRAVSNANHVLTALRPFCDVFGASETYVTATIFANTPRWLGGDRALALSLLNTALYLDVDPAMKPHARAFMLMTLGDIEWHLGRQKSAFECYAAARKLIAAIEEEDSPDCERQLVEVMAAIAFFYYEHGESSERYWAEKLLYRALELGDRVSKDQAEKIRVRWWELRS